MKNKLLFSLKLVAATLLFASISFVSVGQTTTLPTIDGDGSDAAWNIATAYPITSVINDDDITGADDLSGTVQVIWSADSLYYLCEVKDELLYGGTGAAYNYDNICIYLDVFNKATDSYVDTTQMYWEKNWWQAYDQMGGRFGADWTTPPGNFGVDTTSGTGYTIELAVAWADLGATSMQVSSTLGFDIKLSDNDGGEGEPRSQLAFRDVTDGGWNNPSVWGEITLAADGSTVANKSFAPAVDADDSERAWATATTVDLESIISVEGVENAADLSGNFKLNWTADTLYVYAVQKDDSLYHGSGNAYLYDNICVYLDIFNKKTDSYVDSTQMYFEKNWWDTYEQMGGRTGADWAAPNGNFAVDTTSGKDYVIELAIPVKAIGGTELAVNDTLGFDVKLSDNDGGEDELRAQITYMDITDGGWGNPSLFGEIVLLEGGYVDAISSRPAAPAAPTAVVAESIVTLTWDGVDGAASYNVYINGAMVAEAITDTVFVDTLANGDYVANIQLANADGVLSNKGAGTEFVVDAVGVENDVVASNTKLFPNPASSQLTIESVEDIQKVYVVNMNGQIVKHVNVNQMNTTIDVSDLKTGLYFVRVQFENTTVNSKVIVE